MLKIINEIANKTVEQFTRGVTSGCQQIIPGTGRSPETRVDDNTLVELNVSWANICADRISKRVAQVPLRLYAMRPQGGQAIRAPHRVLSEKERKALVKYNGVLGGSRVSRFKSHQAIQAADVVEITEHPFLDLYHNMNPWFDNFEVIEETQQFIDTTGDGYWMMDFDPITGLPSALWSMQSQKVAIVPDKNNFIAGYLFGCDPVGKRPGPDTVGLLPKNVVHFRRPNLRDQYYGMGCLEAAIGAHMLNREQQQYNRALNKNMGVPSLIATFKDTTVGGGSLKKVRNMLDKTLRGTDKAGRSFVTTGDMDIKVVGLSQREMSFLEGQKWTRLEICDAYGVPLALVDTENVNRANAEAANYQFEAFTVKPRLQKIADKINSQIIPWYDEPRIFVAFDENVPEDNAFELRRTIELFGGSITKRNEARASQGLTLLTPEEGGDDFIVIGGSTTNDNSGSNEDQEDPNAEEMEEIRRNMRDLQERQARIEG
jgi:HK97 family phage portal protein